MRTKSLTRYEDHSSADVERFSLADLRVGDYVEVRAYRDGGRPRGHGAERDDASGGRVEVGPCDRGGGAELRGRGRGGGDRPADRIQGQQRWVDHGRRLLCRGPGPEVKVRGTLVGNTVLADRAELED